MTQFGCRVSFDDSEMQTLQRALSHYLEVCQREIKKGGDVPFTAHRGTIKRFRAKSREVLKLTQSLALDENDMDVVQHALKGIWRHANERSQMARPCRSLPIKW